MWFELNLRLATMRAYRENLLNGNREMVCFYIHLYEVDEFIAECEDMIRNFDPSIWN